MSTTIVASVTFPAKPDDIVRVSWSLGNGLMHESSIGREDLHDTESYLVSYASTHLMRGRAPHGIAMKYNSTVTDDGLRGSEAGIAVYEIDFDDAPMDRYFQPIADVYNEKEFQRRYDESTETAISIIMAAGYRQPEMADDLGVEVQDEVQSLLTAAMMRSEPVSKTLFGAINDHIRLIELGNPIPTGDDSDPVLICACGEYFDTIETAKAHLHDPEAFDGAEENEFDFRISTRGEAV